MYIFFICKRLSLAHFLWRIFGTCVMCTNLQYHWNTGNLVKYWIILSFKLIIFWSRNRYFGREEIFYDSFNGCESANAIILRCSWTIENSFLILSLYNNLLVYTIRINNKKVYTHKGCVHNITSCNNAILWMCTQAKIGQVSLSVTFSHLL